jgi:DNA-directed DNA polymerase III PolC
MSHYLPIHIHTDFSIGDALLNVDSYVAWAKEHKYPSLTVTDHGNICASLYFNQVATKAGIKSIIGVEGYCTFKHEFESDDKDEKRERDHFIILAKNYKGYENLMLLVGKSMRETFYYKPVILYEELFKHKENLIVSTACMGGRLAKLVIENKFEEAEQFVALMKSEFNDDFYLEIMEVQQANQTAFNNWVINNYKRLGVKVIWTTDTHYLKPEHTEVHDVMKLCNAKKSFLDHDWKDRVYSSRNLYLKTREDILNEAQALNYDLNIVNEFLDNTLEIDAKIEKVKLTRAPEVIMPKFSDNSYEILEKKTFEALKEKGWDKNQQYVDRMKHELEIIKFKKMEDYFLIVADIVRFAEENGAFVGAGRGSGAGSLVVHLLGITKVDPIKYNLFFERFLNEKRLDPPDIDLDFCSKNRYKIEIYLKEKYGLDAVSHVISFGTFGIKNSIRDTFRVYFGTDKKDDVDKLSKCLENEDDDFDECLEKMIALEGDFAKKFIEEHRKQFEIAKVLVGKNRHISMHAGGVIIAPDKLEKYIPIMRVKDQIATGFPEGGDVRLMTEAGLMKFDILGLNACTIINETLKQLKGKTSFQQITQNDNDQKTLEQFRLGNTLCIFQFEGKNITKFVKRVKPTKFTDLIAINALYRPATINAGGLDLYLKNKNSFDEEKAKKDPFLNVLAETYGVLAYQEEAMQIFQDLGGFTLAEADETRHVFKLLFKGNTNFEDFNRVMAKFRDGCHKTTNYDDKKIDEIMELMKKFSSYSFNKCIAHDSKIDVYKKNLNFVETVSIEKLYENKEEYDRVSLYNFTSKTIIQANIKEVVKTGIKQTYYVITQDNTNICTTLKHKFLTIYGWKQLKDLRIYDEVFVFNKEFGVRLEKIMQIDSPMYEETYDIHVDHQDHNYIANNFIVHNSHSCAYALMAYVMMYLRTHYPAEFFSSLLANTDNSETTQDGKKVNLFQNYVTEIQKTFKVNILKPDINESKADVFKIKDQNTLYYALGHIKDVGEKAAIEIEKKQPFTSFADFLSKVTRRIVNKRVVKALVYSEALKFSDTIELYRKEYKEDIDLQNFLSKQFEYTSIIFAKDLKEAFVDKEYSLKSVENAVNQGKFLNKDRAIPVIVFISKFRKLAGNSKKTGRPYVMNFATLYDGTSRVDDCILNNAQDLHLQEGDLVRGKLYFEEAKNKKYSDVIFYLSDIKRVISTSNYNVTEKFNVEDPNKIVAVIEEVKKEIVKEEIKPEVIEKVEVKVETKVEIKDEKQITNNLISRKTNIAQPMITRRKLINDKQDLATDIKTNDNSKKLICRRKTI